MTLANPTSARLATGLRLVSASAGSGKTYHLTQAVTRAVEQGLPIESLLGVTYTVKAHAELEARIRRVLIQSGAFERAEELPLAFLGTVHAVCLRLLEKFALEAGLAPTLSVIPGDEERRLLQAALEHAFDFAKQERLRELTLEFKFEWDDRLQRSDWLTPVDEIMDLARGNRILPSQLRPMAERSLAGLQALLPPAADSGAPLERALEQAVHNAIEAIARLDEPVNDTRSAALAYLRECAARLATGSLAWPAWAKLAALEAGKRAKPLLAPVREAARAYDHHPRFQAGLRELGLLLFEAAEVGLEAYGRLKKERGLLDYVDMIDLALDLVDCPAVAAELRERLALTVVDEFQDTSPIQLALFMRLHALTQNSIWVGDQKQCIFEYAGADPELMEAVIRWAREHGGDTSQRLERNYRSRPELVRATGSLFAAAFAKYGYPPEEVVSHAKRAPLGELDALPPFGVFRLAGKSLGDAQSALAEGLARLLRHPERTPVLDRVSGNVRPLRAGDLAVLFYTNAEAQSLAQALAKRSIPSALARTGLLTTPEGTLITAALRFLVDARDTLARAELEMLTGAADEPERWLAQTIRSQTTRETASSEALADGDLDCVVGDPVTTALDRLRDELSELSPSETLDRVLARLDVPALAICWPEPEQRLANLDALRALARDYERRAAYLRESASLSGLLRYFEETQQELRRRDEMRASDEQHVSRTEDAIVISTYHKAKGLEWPVVVLGSLDRKPKGDAFSVALESDAREFDASAPLSGRWIRYWPWPLGKSGTSSRLAERAESSPEGQAATQRERHERLRLLYVGFTRARDHLILAIRKKSDATAWLDELTDAHGPLISLPEADGAPLALRGTEPMQLPARVWQLTPGDGLDPEHPRSASAPRHWFTPMNDLTANAPEIPAYRLAPSRAAEEPLNLPSARVLSVNRFTARLPFINPKGTSFDQIGTALHAFLAADRAELTPRQRTDTAHRILESAGLHASFEPHALITQSDALRQFIEERWPSALWHRELPISALIPTPHGERRIHGTIDLLLETPAGYVIIDHKSFPGKASEWEERALAYAPQLFAYAQALRMAGGTVNGMFIHFTIGGGIVEVTEGGRTDAQ